MMTAPPASAIVQELVHRARRDQRSLWNFVPKVSLARPSKSLSTCHRIVLALGRAFVQIALSAPSALDQRG